MTPHGVVLTDAPLPKDDACPQCRADASRRVLSGGFGVPFEVCSQCGHQFKEPA